MVHNEKEQVIRKVGEDRQCFCKVFDDDDRHFKYLQKQQLLVWHSLRLKDYLDSERIIS